jgi:hypothetical protein
MTSRQVALDVEQVHLGFIQAGDHVIHGLVRDFIISVRLDLMVRSPWQQRQAH